MVGSLRLWELLALKDAVIPEGVEKIGKRWFAYSSIESVTIPASALVIGTESFCNCPYLKSVKFAAGNRLKIIGKRSF